MASELGKVIPVKVALRARPLVPKEVEEGCSQCLQFIPEVHQVVLGNNKAFTYDYVFDPQALQSDVYESSVKHLVKGLFNGYNATVLAYGQTGSGKTYTMGGGYGMFLPDANQEYVGIIPRVIADIFEGINERADEFDFLVKVSYLEIYKEDLVDLLVPSAKREENAVQIREDIDGGIKMQGLSERQVVSAEDLLSCLEEGSQSRTVGATAMNATSSRSHAIFTIYVERCSKTDENDMCKAKFHLVDLAGSERAKRTQAEGTRFKEGVNINRGLLALGNVISALGEEASKRAHIPYRDSKLTRLLQDSLGGNSHTVMIACVSPADSNMEETLGTLRYADRARKIKNKPVVNRDPQAAEILRLKQMVQNLQVELAQNGKSGGSTGLNQSQEYSFDVATLKEEYEALLEENKRLSASLQAAVNENATNLEMAIAKEMALENLKQKVERFKEKFGLGLSRLEDTTFMENVEKDGQKEEGEEKQAESHEKDDEESKPKSAAPKALDICKEIEECFGDIDLTADAVMLGEGGSKSPPGNGHNDTLSVESQAMMQRRAELNRDLADLNGRLENAEAYRKQLMQNSESWDSIKQKYEVNIKNLEKDIEKLQEEKAEMNKELQSKNNSAACKIAESRRQRLQQLELQIGELRAKVKEQSKMLKMKQQKEEQVTKLTQEIQLMKQQRVKMYKQLKEDNAAFQKFKQAKDKEVLQLKAKERKHQAELAKMERQSERQQSVLRRKAEEAAAANRRLKEALGKQKLAQEERLRKQETTDASGVGNRIRKWLSHDLEVAVSVEEVTRLRRQFLEDRKELTQQLNNCKRRLEDELGPSAPKRRTLNDSFSEDMESDEVKELKEEIKHLETEVEMRTAQINDLQQKLLDVDGDEKTKNRFNSVHTLIEAKCGLRYLLNQAVEARMALTEQKSADTDARSEYKELLKQLKRMKEELREERKQHQVELQQLKLQHEENTQYLLQSLKHSSFSEKSDDAVTLQKRLEIQAKELSEMAALREQLDAKTRECEVLKQELTGVVFNQTRGCNDPLFPEIIETQKKKAEETPGFFNPIFSNGLQSHAEEAEESGPSRIMDSTFIAEPSVTADSTDNTLPDATTSPGEEQTASEKTQQRRSQRLRNRRTRSKENLMPPVDETDQLMDQTGMKTRKRKLYSQSDNFFNPLE